MSKFITRVAMPCTNEQYKTDLKEPMEKLGYVNKGNRNGNILVNDIGFYLGDMGLIVYQSIENTRIQLKEYNPELFLALCAMTNEEYGIAGEWFMNVRDYLWFTKGEIYKCIGREKNSIQLIDNDGHSNRMWDSILLSSFRKASVDQIIAHFTQQPKVEPKKEIQKEIVGYVCPMDLYGGTIKKGQIFERKGNDTDFEIGCPVPTEWIKTWEKVYKSDEEVINIGFDLVIRDGRVWHKKDDITNFVISLVETIEKHKNIISRFHNIERYEVEVLAVDYMTNEVVFIRTGCEKVKTTLTQWKSVYDKIKK